MQLCYNYTIYISSFLSQAAGVEVWVRKIQPKGSYAVVFLNLRVNGTPSVYTTTLRDIGLTNRKGYHVQELFRDFDYGFMHPGDVFKCRINPTGVIMITAIVQEHKD